MADFQTPDEMQEFALERKNANANLYKAQSDAHRGEMLSKDIAAQKTALQKFKKMGRPTRFDDLEAIHAQTIAYLSTCEAAQTFPSVMGLAKALGVTRRALERYIAEHDNETSRYLEGTKDVFADILVNASLYNLANPAQAIFQLKNHFDHADVHTLEAKQPEPLGTPMEQDDIMKQIASLPEPDDE